MVRLDEGTRVDRLLESSLNCTLAKISLKFLLFSQLIVIFSFLFGPFYSHHFAYPKLLDKRQLVCEETKEHDPP